eukprot:CAMPEP_0181308314 /NCGR_PEP_ID=MMETSP1101-20121128/11394_1 /TAXON_ID=46948 /ORGANISM="Rhodomonas abbreviata, Strain Caron Lab Isolate" /LENGTH=387 /DNA_ID=CAMNT_0023414683 /DNA_START=248 /DNA_END=1411 /DNA_ORIENTATION=-
MSAGDMGFVVPGPAGAAQAPTAMMMSPVTASGAALFKHLSLKEPGNVVISPLSIFVAVSMATSGSTLNGKANEELRRMLRHDVVGDEDSVHDWVKAMILSTRQTDPKVQLDVANSVWAAGDVSPAYMELCKKFFDAEAFSLAGKDPINKWVDSKTNSKIPSILEQDPPGPAVIVNAVFFKGEWGSKFEEKDSVKGQFFGFDAPFPCTFMRKDEKKMLYAETPTAQLAQLPYGTTGRFGAIIALPTKPGKAGLDRAITSLFEESTWQQAVSGMRKTHVKLQLPRFKIEYGVKSLKEALQGLGVEAAFTPGGHFMRMVEDASVYIDDVFHKAVIEVNEEGTVAAAATAVVMTRSLPPPATEMKVERPFLFAVYDLEGKHILFVCKVVTV